MRNPKYDYDDMPNKKSAMKELRKSTARATFNANYKKRIKDTLKKIQKALTASKIDDAQKLAKDVSSLLDKAAKHNIVHKNTASRKKSRVQNAIKKAASKK